MAEQLIRNSHLSDDSLMIHSEVVLDRFVVYHPRYTAFNSVKYHPDFHLSFKEMIDAGIATLSDEFVVKEQANKTAASEALKKKLGKKLNLAQLVVEDTFGDDPTRYNEFHLNNISKYIIKVDSLIGFTKDVIVLLKKNHTELLANGLHDNFIFELEALVDELDLARRAQIEMIHARPVHTKNRIEKMNDLWKTLSDLSKAAEFVFEDEPELRDLFALPKPVRNSSSGESDDSETEEIDAE